VCACRARNTSNVDRDERCAAENEASLGGKYVEDEGLSGDADMVT